MNLHELHAKAVELYGKSEVMKMLENFYKTINKTPAICEEVIKHLNQCTNAKFSIKSKAAIKHIKARLSEGYTADDLKKVNVIKSNHWLETENARFLRPATLYNSEKMEGYLAEYSRWESQKQIEKRKQQEIKTKQLAKEGKAVRTNLKSWKEFKTYDSLWSYVAKMNQQEFESYELPDKLRTIQSKWLIVKFDRDSTKRLKIEEMFNKLIME